jgi:hypothetical protein
MRHVRTDQVEGRLPRASRSLNFWISAFAGMTIKSFFRGSLSLSWIFPVLYHDQWPGGECAEHAVNRLTVLFRTLIHPVLI